MKNAFIKIVALFVLLMMFSPINASECYRYRTKTSNEIKVENGKPYWIQIVKDPNGISIASYKKTILNIKPEKIRIVSEDRNGTIIANSEYYYWINGLLYHSENIELGKIIETKKVSKHFGKSTFLINGKWTHIAYNPYTKKSEYKIISNFPKNPVVIKHYTEGRGESYLIKDESKVYVYDEGEKTINVIPNLTPQKTHFFETDWLYDEHFLYDDDTFYLIGINFDNPQEITEQFKSLGLKYKFTQSTIRDVNHSFFLDFQDGDLWAYAKNGVSLTNGDDVFFYPLENAKYLENIQMIYFNNLFYDDSWGLINEQDGIDFSEIKNWDKLKLLFNNIYSDGATLYELINDNGKRILRKTEKYGGVAIFNNLQQKHNNALFSYRHNMPAFWTDGKSAFSLNATKGEFENLIDNNSRLIDLKLAYALDNKLYIEGKIIESIMDVNSVAFLGSTVEVINGCDGGDGRSQVEVEYNYYFKDKNGIYQYHTGKKELEKLPLKNPQEYNENNFIEKILKDRNYGWD